MSYDGSGSPPDAWPTGPIPPTGPSGAGPVQPDEPTVSLPPWARNQPPQPPQPQWASAPAQWPGEQPDTGEVLPWDVEATQSGVGPAAWYGDPTPRPPRRGQSVVAMWVALAVLVLVGGGIAIYAVAHTSSNGHQAGGSGAASSSQSGAVGGFGRPSADTGSAGAPSTSAPPSQPASSVSSSTDPGQQVATQVDGILNRSVSVRSGVQPALTRIAGCTAGTGDIAALQHAADVRRQLAGQLPSVRFEDVRNGPALRSALARLLTASADADDAYIQWGTDQAGCHGRAHNDSAKKRGDSLSQQATADKRGFLRLWNPIAVQYGLQPRQQADI